jgi:hypothetical protein
MEKRRNYFGRQTRWCRTTNKVVAFLLLGIVNLPLLASDQNNLSPDEDSQYREELGVNRFTTPSIEELFGILDSLKPIPFAELDRPVEELNTDDRTRYALAFGTLIANGFLATEEQNGRHFDALGRELLRRARGLGVEGRISRHSKRVLDLARQGRWPELRKELVVTQRDMEQALLSLRDEEMVHLLSLGGWIRGLEIAAASVASSYSPERADKLRKLDLLDYYLDRLSTLGARLKKRPLIEQITAGLQTARQLLGQTGPAPEETVTKLRDLSHSLVDLIEKEPVELEAAPGPK